MTRKPESPIDEIHRTRRQISEKFGGDINAIAEDAARRQAASDRPVWRPDPNKPAADPRAGNGQADGQRD